MNKVIEVLKNIWKITELKDRIGLTLILLVVYRFGAQVVLPGIDATKLGQIAENTEQGILGLLNAFTGGAFANASVFALGIMPYISASIVVQLMGIAIPYLQKLQKEGASGQKKNHSNHQMAYYCNLFGSISRIFDSFASTRYPTGCLSTRSRRYVLFLINCDISYRVYFCHVVR